MSRGQLVEVDSSHAMKVAAGIILYIDLMLVLGQVIRLTFPEGKYGLNFRQVSIEAWVLVACFWAITLLINSLKFRFTYWRKAWNFAAIGSMLAIAGTAGNFIEAALTRAVTDFIPTRILGKLWIINVNDVLIVLGAGIFLLAAVTFIYKTVRWMFYYEFRNLMQN